MTAAPEAEATTSARPVLALTLAVTAMALLPVGVTGTNLAFPDIEADFVESSRATLSWALSGYSIVIAAFTLLGGQLSDRFDADRMFAVGLAVLAVASLLAGLAPNAAVLIAGRGVQGIGGALLVSSSLVVATTAWPANRHTMVIGIWTAAFPIGSAFAPTLTAVVLEVASWRWVFLLTGALAATALLVDRTVRSTGPLGDPDAVPARGHPDYLGIVAGTAAVGLAALGIVQGPTWGWTSLGTIGVLVVAVALVPLVIGRSRRHPRPMLDLALFRIRTYSLATLVNVLVSMAGVSVWLIWPLLMTNQWGYGRLTVGIAITPAPLLAGIGSVVSARIASRHGFRWILIGGMSALVVSNLWFVWALGSDADYVGAMLPGLLLFGVGMGLTFAPINVAALVDVPPSAYGRANAAFTTGRFLAGAIGIAAVVAALGEPGSDPLAAYDRAFLLLAAVSLAGLVIMAVGWPSRSASRPD